VAVISDNIDIANARSSFAKRMRGKFNCKQNFAQKDEKNAYFSEKHIYFGRSLITNRRSSALLIRQKILQKALNIPLSDTRKLFMNSRAREHLILIL
jgi:hypothetical protein